VASIQHVVEPGDSLLYIAIKYGITVEAITSLNGITDPNALLKIGQVLLIPATTPTAVPFPTAIPAGLRTHTVQQGDTLLDIALKYNTTVEVIAALNGITSVHELQIGQVLLIPK
jgi:LysM repeat protein